MAIRRISKKAQEDIYVGYSSDARNTTYRDGVPTDVRNGTIFIEIDTGKQEMFFNGAWEKDKRLIYALREAQRTQE